MNEEITHLDLCSGIGGFALAIADAGRRTNRDVSTIAFCEPDKFCQQVLNKHWPDVPIYDDVKTFPKDFGNVNVLTAGYPCQSFSQAGKRKGEADDRYIWPWVLEIVKQTRPTLCVFENVVGHISLGIDTVLLDLANEGYHAWPCILGAVSKNAPHRRQRVFIISYAHSKRKQNGAIDTQAQGELGNMGYSEYDGSSTSPTPRGMLNQSKEPKGSKKVRKSKGAGSPSRNVADTDSPRQQQSYKEMETRSSEQFDSGSFQPREDVADTKFSKLQGSSEKQVYGQSDIQGQSGRSSEDASKRSPTFSRLGRTFDGLSTWVDADDWERGVPRVTQGQKDKASRLKALGNAIVPQVASEIFTAIFESELL